MRVGLGLTCVAALACPQPADGNETALSAATLRLTFAERLVKAPAGGKHRLEAATFPVRLRMDTHWSGAGPDGMPATLPSGTVLPPMGPAAVAPPLALRLDTALTDPPRRIGADAAGLSLRADRLFASLAAAEAVSRQQAAVAEGTAPSPARTGEPALPDGGAGASPSRGMAASGTVVPLEGNAGENPALVGEIPDDDDLLPEESPVGTGKEAARKPRWRLAPILWGGTLSETVTRYEDEDGANRLSLQHRVAVRGQSFIMAPWFARVNGNLNLSLLQLENTAGDGAAKERQDGTSVSGGMGLYLFPFSRFPFQASVDVTDSRTTGELTNTEYTSTRVSLRQDYRPPKSNDRYSAGYDRSVVEDQSGGRDTVDRLFANHFRTVGAHTWNAEGNLAWSERDREDTTDNRIFNATVRHTWRPDAPYHVDNNASVNDTRFGGGLTDVNSRFLQLTSNLSWQPAAERPLNVNAGGFLYGVDGDVNDDQRMAVLVGANAGVSYAWTPHLNVNGALSLSHNNSPNSSSSAAYQTAGVNYTPATVKLGNFSYAWGTGASLSNNWASTQGTSRNLGLTANHSLSRVWRISASSSLSAGISQAGNVNQGSGAIEIATRSLSHNANLTWQYSTAQGSLSSGLNASESRSWGDNPSRFQTLNLNVNGQMPLSRYSFLTANISLQSTRNHSRFFLDNTDGTTTEIVQDSESDGAFGNVGYTHSRLFGVRNLRYSLLFNINTIAEGRTREQGNPDALPDRVDKSLEQRVDYRIGRLNANLTHRLAEIAGKRSSSLTLSVGRDFGAF